MSAIYFHTVKNKRNPNWARNFLTLELKYFQNYLKLFKSLKLNPVFLEEHWEKGKEIRFKKNDLNIQFDDGFLDNWIFAYPLIKKYNLKATIFVNPEFVDEKNIKPRPNLEDYWNGNISLDKLNSYDGYLNWEEMRLMEGSGHIEIQSHTMTHTKYFASDKIIGFHHKGADCLYPIGNEYKNKKPYYISNDSFEKLIPYGTPFFEEKSAVVTKIRKTNPELNSLVIDKLQPFLSNYNFEKWYSAVLPIYLDYSVKGKVFSNIETDEEFNKRVHWELAESKKILEEKLSKKIYFVCWPHGENDDFAHNTALSVGYKATSVGKYGARRNDSDRFDRFGLHSVKDNVLLTKLKAIYKVQSFREVFPYNIIRDIHHEIFH